MADSETTAYSDSGIRPDTETRPDLGPRADSETVADADTTLMQKLFASRNSSDWGGAGWDGDDMHMHSKHGYHAPSCSMVGWGQVSLYRA